MGLGDWKSKIIDDAVRQAVPQAVADIQILKAQTILQPSDLLNAFGNPPVLTAPPGVGFMHHPIFAVLEYDPVTTDYTGAATNLYIGPQTDPTTLYVLQPISINLINGTYAPSPAVAVAPPTNVVMSQVSSFDNQPLVLTIDGGSELVNGDGTLTVSLYYIVVPN